MSSISKKQAEEELREKANARKKRLLANAQVRAKVAGIPDCELKNITEKSRPKAIDQQAGTSNSCNSHTAETLTPNPNNNINKVAVILEIYFAIYFGIKHAIQQTGFFQPDLLSPFTTLICIEAFRILMCFMKNGFNRETVFVVSIASMIPSLQKYIKILTLILQLYKHLRFTFVNLCGYLLLYQLTFYISPLIADRFH